MITTGSGRSAGPDHPAGQPVLAVQVACSSSIHTTVRGDGAEPARRPRPARRVHQPPARQQRPDRLHRAPGLPDRGPADQQYEPTPLGGGRHLGPDTGLGGIDIARHVLRQDIIGTPGTLIAACTPSRRRSASLTRTAPPVRLSTPETSPDGRRRSG